MLKAIETMYKGYKFRSRIEARWAVFFDALGIKYEYEKEGFDLDGVRYLPDFYLPEQGIWIEIKGQVPTDLEIKKAALLSKHSGQRVYILSGEVGLHAEDWNDYNATSAHSSLFLLHGDIIHQGCAWAECDTCNCIMLRPVWNTIRLIDIDYSWCECHKRLESERLTKWHQKVNYGYPINSDRLISAYTSARQARFEHGETPIITPAQPKEKYIPEIEALPEWDTIPAKENETCAFCKGVFWKYTGEGTACCELHYEGRQAIEKSIQAYQQEHKG